MEITLTSIPADGLHVVTTLSLEGINDRFDDKSSPGAHFTEAPAIDVRVDNTLDGTMVSGKIVTCFVQPCGNCLEEQELKVEKDVNLFLKPTPSSGVDEEADIDSGFMWYRGDVVNLEEYFQDLLILCVPPFGFEHKGCPGHESLLDGKEEKEETRFAQLLRGAGVESSDKDSN